jgi:uncharacterized protein YciI
MADPDTHILLLYDYVEDVLERRGPHRAAHLEKITQQREAGNLVMAGALGDPPIGGALVFKGVDPEYVEEFVRDDPYVKAGLVTAWRAQPWRLV